MKSLGKILLIALLLAAAGLVCLALVWFAQWPAWAGWTAFGACVVLLLAFGFVRRVASKLFAGSRARDALKAPEPEDKKPENLMPELVAEWKRGIALIRKSSLSRFGNPIYALPWYVALGTKNAGKTAALQHARLASPIQEVNLVGQVKPTRTLDWWLFEKAVLLDLSSRYVVDAGEKTVHAEWQKFLSMLAGVRRKEPLNGLIVAIAADELLYGSREVMLERTRSLRNRIDQLMRLTDTRFPVYVVVTKCDMLYGMTEFSENLPPETLNQALGYVHQADARYARDFLDNAFASVAERLRDLRLVLTRDMDQVPAGLLLFPNEFERLKSALDEFFGAAFGDDPYMEAPMLRGLFFTSSRQGGGVSSFVLKDSNLPDQTRILKVKDKGLFLKDLFGNLLAHDRALHQPLGQALRWGRITRNLGLACWVGACALAGIAMTASFMYSWQTVNALKQDFPGIPALSGKLAQDLNALKQQDAALTRLAERNDHWWVRAVPFSEPVLALEQRLELGFANAFNRFAVGEFDTRLARRLNPFAGVPDPQPVDIQFVVRRLNLLKAAAAGTDAMALAGMPDPVPDNLALAKIHGEVSPYDLAAESARDYGQLYRAYLRRQPQGDVLAEERRRLEGWLSRLAAAGGNMAWLTVWVDEQPGMRPVTLADFWPGSRRAEARMAVPAAFTQRGRAAIDRFMAEVEKSAGPQGFAARRAAFNDWYRAERLKRWLEFIDEFDRGKLTLASESEWRALLPGLTGDQGPYAAVLLRLTAEFKDVGDEAAPDWLKLARRWQGVRSLGKVDDVLGQAAVAKGVISGAGPQLFRDSVAGGLARAKGMVEQQISAGKSYATYASEVAKAAKEAEGGIAKAAAVAAGLFPAGAEPAAAAPKESPLLAAGDALADLHKTLIEPSAATRPVWRIIDGPLQFVFQYVQQQASCNLQNEWGRTVLFPLQAAATPAEGSELLYGQKGVLWVFTDNAAKGFLQKGARAFSPVEARGAKILFTDEFLNFANDALSRQQALAMNVKRAEVQKEQAQVATQQGELETKKSNDDLARRAREIEAQLAQNRQAQEKLRATPLTLTLNALPTHVNQDARAFPFATLLTLQCAPEPKTLVNYNYPATGSFAYSPTQCGDVSMQIKVESLSLTKLWTGPNALPQFLLDFYDGQHAFKPEDFPGQKPALDALNIKLLDVRYQFAGHLQILRQADELFDLKQRESTLAAELKRAQTYLAGVEDKTYLEKKDALKVKQEDLVQKEKQIGNEVLAALRVPASVAQCWTPSIEWLLARPRDFEIPALVEKRPAPTPAPKVRTGSDYQIQVGAFREPEKNALVARLRADGHEPVVLAWEGGKATLYRVRIGAFATREDAQAGLPEIDRRYNVKSASVQRDLSGTGAPPSANPETPAAIMPAVPERGPQPAR